jgi:hypothetical protein
MVLAAERLRLGFDLGWLPGVLLIDVIARSGILPRTKALAARRQYLPPKRQRMHDPRR